MLKKRIVFQLLSDGEYFYLSRNFNLQKVGDLRWLSKMFDLDSLLGYVDEISVVNVSKRDPRVLEEHLGHISRSAFTPMSLTGGIDSLETCHWLVDMGVEKWGFKSKIFTEPEFLAQVADEFGSQALLAHLDYRDTADDGKIVYSDGGSVARGSLESAVAVALDSRVGEIVFHSISREGTGRGFDSGIRTDILNCGVPATLSGGAGQASHFHEVFDNPAVTGFATANLLNFIRGGIKSVRDSLSGSYESVSKLEPPQSKINL